MPDETTLNIDVPSEPAPEAGNQDNVDKRIATVVKQKHEAVRQTDEVKVQLAAVQQELAALRLSQVPPTAQAPAPDPLADLFAPATPTKTAPVANTSPEDIKTLVAQAVQGVMNKFEQRDEQKVQAQALQQRQTASFHNAAEFLPSVLDTGSRAQELFDDMWASNPGLSQMEDGPALAVHAVAGILGQPSREAHKEERKRAASPPQPSIDVTKRVGLAPDDQSTKNKGLVDALTAKSVTSEGLTQDELKAYIGVKTGRANAT